ncbi:MAG TPA: membrane protein insertase YidC [Vicinamibacteria bacterium]|nr:membrane protein insertase YidC [Vicinamibacteria bacterium]
MEERRLLLAVALSLLVLTAYSLLFSPPPPAPAPATAVPQAGPATALTPAPGPAEAAPPAAAEATRAAVAAPPAAPVVDPRERRVELVAPDFTVAFTNRGARLVSWTLSRYRDARGAPEEMVPAGAGVRPLDLETGIPELDASLRDALFVPSAETLALREDEPQLLRFEFASGEIEARKTLTFRAAGLVEVSVIVKRAGREVPTRLLWGPGIGNPSAEEREVQGYQEPAGVALAGSGVLRRAASSIPDTGESLAGVRWAGVESHYFAALFVAPGAPLGASLRKQSVPAVADEKPHTLPVVAVDVAGGAPLQLFVGAKDHQAMARLGHGLERVVPVGDWIGPIVVPLMGLLRFVQERVGNWGWSIVVLTVLINLAMAPFRHYSIVNGIKMARLGPEMRQIQDRYRKVPLMDPRRQQMQEEVAALYARHGMSMGSQMMVGCLPLLLTMPFLFAFYRVLTVSVDLRGADYLWIPDLAQKDPLFLTPVLMGVSMFVMQKMTPSTLDPAQQRIMMLMPLMLAGMFLWAPAGLNLYWLTSNLWSILQQAVSLRLLQPQAARERREKKGR